MDSEYYMQGNGFSISFEDALRELERHGMTGRKTDDPTK